MSKFKVLIVEDELIIAEDMIEMLEELNYSVIGTACDCSEAEEIMEKDVPDIALIDIQLRCGDDGIELARTIKEKYDIPFVFITSHSDQATVEKAKHMNPAGYIVKPFEKSDLYTSIEIAIFNHKKTQHTSSKLTGENDQNVILKDSIFIKKDYMLIKVKFDELVWIKSDGNYLELHCIENKHLIRSTLKEFMVKLPTAMFLQVHKSYSINVNYIKRIEHSSVWINNTQIPIGRSHLETVKKVLKIEI